MINKLKNKLQKIPAKSKTVYKNVIGAFMIKGLSLLLSLFTLPAYINFFNNQTELGLWFTILTVLSWVFTFDLGIGNGLRNHLACVLTVKDMESSRRYISSAYLSITALVVIISAIFCFLFQFLNWNAIFNIKVSVVSQRALLITVVIVFLGIMVQFILKLITSVLYALQKSAVTNFLSLITSVICLIFVLLAPSGSNSRNMIIMAVVNAVAVNLPLLVCTIVLFRTKLRFCCPSLHSFSIETSKKVLGLGGVFFFVQIIYMVITNTNEYLITLFSGSGFVVDYQIYFRIFSLISTFFVLTLTPIWSMVTKALAEKDYLWIKRLYHRLVHLAFIFCLAEFMIIPIVQLFINVWLQENAIAVNYFYAFMFSILGCTTIFNCVFSSIANGLGELKTQAICFSIGAALKIPLAYGLIVWLNSWIGVVIANAISMSLYCIIQPLWLRKNIPKLRENLIVEED